MIRILMLILLILLPNSLSTINRDPFNGHRLGYIKKHQEAIKKQKDNTDKISNQNKQQKIKKNVLYFFGFVALLYSINKLRKLDSAKLKESYLKYKKIIKETALRSFVQFSFKRLFEFLSYE